MTGFDAKAETKPVEGDAQTPVTADTAATGLSVRSPFRLVVHFSGPDRIRGGHSRDFLHGTPSETDHFDADAGGDDILFGMSGDDVYWLGRGTGRDTIMDSGGAEDVIRLKDGLTADDVRLVVGGSRRIHVALVDTAGAETDRYTIAAPFFGVERVELSNGEMVFDESDFIEAWVGFVRRVVDSGHDVVGRLGGDEFTWDWRTKTWIGSQSDDSFLAGNDSSDVYQGRGGNDIYWLGARSGHDRVNEHEGNPTGDPGDAIVIMSEVSAPRRGLGADLESAVPVDGGPTAWVRSSQDGRDLVIDVVERHPDGQVTTHSSLTVDEFFFRGSAQVEQIVFADDPWATLSLRELRSDRIRGGDGRDFLHGTSGTDHFDADGGGDDILFGMSGDDVYWLGRGTGRDTIVETDGSENVIRLEGGLAADDVRLVRDMRGYHVLLTDADGTETDRYTIARGFGVRRVELSNGETVFDGSDFAAAPLTPLPAPSHPAPLPPVDLSAFKVPTLEDLLSGRIPNNVPEVRNPSPVVGTLGTDHFDTSGGSQDTLWGMGGDDVYWLGRGTGKDRILDFHGSGDAIRLKSGLVAGDVRLTTDKKDFHVALVDSNGAETDRYTIAGGIGSSVKRVELSNGDTVFDEDDFFDAWEQPETSGFVLERDVSGHRNLHRWTGSRADDSFLVGSPGKHNEYSGFGGNDVYWLGIASGHGTVAEAWGNSSPGDPGDVIVVESGISAPRQDMDWTQAWNQVRKDKGEPLRDELGRGDGFPVAWVHRSRGGGSLVIDVVERLSDGTLAKYSSLTVENFFLDPRARVEQVVFADDPRATLSWEDLWDLPHLPIIDGPGDDTLHGGVGPDIFDSSVGGNDVLFGGGGDDAYYLGMKTGFDRIVENEYDVSYWGDDRVVVKEGIHIPDADQISRVSNGAEPTLRARRGGAGGRDLVLEVTANGEVVSALVVSRHYVEFPQKTRVERFHDAHGREVISLDETMALRISGGPGNDVLSGDHYDNGFDISAGGNDVLHGKAGSDTYWLGADRSGGTGTIHEGVGVRWHTDTSDDFDVIRLDKDISAVGEDGRRRSLEVWRSDDGADLHVAFVVDGDVASSYTVVDQYRADIGSSGVVRGILEVGSISGFEYVYDTGIEAILSVDGHVIHDADDLDRARIVGGEGADNLRGNDLLDDHFDGSRGGSDHLHGYGGDDVYWLGRGTGNDHVHESHPDGTGDPGDAIRIVSPHIGRSGVSVAREGDNLVVGLRGTGDSITVVDHFSEKSAQVEKIELNGATLLVRDVTAAVNAIAEFNAGGWSTTLDLVPDRYWQDPSDSLAGPMA